LTPFFYPYFLTPKGDFLSFKGGMIFAAANEKTLMVLEQCHKE